MDPTAQRRLVAIICTVDMLAAELTALNNSGEAEVLIESTIVQAQGLYRATGSSTLVLPYGEFVSSIRDQLAVVRDELRESGQSPRTADVELMLRATYVGGAGHLPESIVRDHLERMHYIWGVQTSAPA